MQSGKIYGCGGCGAVFESLKDCECYGRGLSCCGEPGRPGAREFCNVHGLWKA